MPPNKQYNRNDALEAAMALFWRQGFDSTTYDDLVRETGASRYGLYGDFGDKRDLYLAALDLYRDAMVTALFGGLEKPDAGLPELLDYFRRIRSGKLRPNGCRGCLMSRAATETAADDAVAERVRAHFARQRRVFRRALQNAQSAGDIPADIDVKRHADLLVGVVQGAAGVAIVGAPMTMLDHMIESALAPLLEKSSRYRI